MCVLYTGTMCSYRDDILTWKYFLHHVSFVREIHQSLVDFSLKLSVILSFDIFFVVSLSKLLNKQLHYFISFHLNSLFGHLVPYKHQRQVPNIKKLYM